MPTSTRKRKESDLIPLYLPMPANLPAIIETRNLRKVFQRGRGKASTEVVAVHDLTFEVKKGEVFGFLGPNGAGKTTTMRMLSTLLTPTSGEAYIVSRKLDNGLCQPNFLKYSARRSESWKVKF